LVLVWCVSVSSGEVSGLTQVLQFPMLFSSRSKLTERGRDREKRCVVLVVLEEEEGGCPVEEGGEKWSLFFLFFQISNLMTLIISPVHIISM
jgi:hypothetical protein